MSTFNGIVKEFPRIRIDSFRIHPNTPPPLACFLSHVHSDHLQGLESLKSPFVYCSAATKRLLLRMEKYPHRINFAKGILEARKQHYRHLKLVLKALPLETPTELELEPKTKIQVTLFDANHCSGAVMFLIEGDGKAVLYTGDVRAEAWWVNSIIRQPTSIPYTFGHQRLDCIYLDTTFASHEDIYRDFPTKAEGVAELIRKVKAFPSNTRFYFRAWTLGYEGVWIALSRALGAKVHVDDYQMRLFAALAEDNRDGVNVADGSALIGFHAGNHYHPGCLTNDETVTIHSCEPGTACHAELAKRKDVVWITPIISRTADGSEVREVGAGGGGGDLYQVPELDVSDDLGMQAFTQLCTHLIKDPAILSKTASAISSAKDGREARLSLEGLGLDFDQEISLAEFFKAVSREGGGIQSSNPEFRHRHNPAKTIHFPYSRHSSHNELRHLVGAFKPKDICPCTVDEESWSEEISMQALFGDLCSDQQWYYDQVNRELVHEKREQMKILGKRKREDEESNETQRSAPSDDVFETAQGDAESDVLLEQHQDVVAKGGEMSNVPTRLDDLDSAAPATARSGDNNNGDAEKPHQEQKKRLEAIKNAFHAINNGRDIILSSRSSRSCSREEPQSLSKHPSQNMGETEHRSRERLQTTDQMSRQFRPDADEWVHIHDTPGGTNIAMQGEVETESQLSLSTRAFESQSQHLPNHQTNNSEDEGREIEIALQLDGSQDTPRPPLHPAPAPAPIQPQTPEHLPLLPQRSCKDQSRSRARREAYRAARLCLRHGDSADWEDLGSGALGRSGHGEVEVELGSGFRAGAGAGAGAGG